MKLSILFLFLAVLAATYAYPGRYSSSRPKKSWLWKIKKGVTKFVQKLWYMNDKCHDLECPKYEVKKKTDDYELRCYTSYAWVGTTYEGETLTSETRKDMFMRLFRYISGENADKVKIEMTVPVATKVEGLGSKKRWTMLFFVPFEHQASPPRPTNPQVSIVRLPETCVYVKSFSWFITTERVERMVKELESDLKKDGLTDFTDPETAYIYGGYDSPWTIPFLRVNEVWLIQK